MTDSAAKKISVMDMETKMQLDIYGLLNLQNKTSSVNLDLQKATNERMESEMKTLASDYASGSGFNNFMNQDWVKGLFTAVSIIAGIGCMVGLMCGGPIGGLAAGVCALIGAIPLALQSINKIETGVCQSKCAGDTCAIKSDTARIKFFDDKNNDVGKKMKDGYQMLSSLVKLFNQLIVTLGDAVNKK
jgi:hypothetical protein